MSSLDGDLHQLHEHVRRRGGVEEGDPRPPVAHARALVEQTDALGAELGKRALDVLDLEADVVETFPLLGDPPGRVGPVAGGLQQLQVRFADRVHRDLRLVLRKVLFVLQRESELLLEDLHGLPQVPHRDGHVLHTLDLHQVLPAERRRTSIVSPASMPRIRRARWSSGACPSRSSGPIFTHARKGAGWRPSSSTRSPDARPSAEAGPGARRSTRCLPRAPSYGSRSSARTGIVRRAPPSSARRRRVASWSTSPSAVRITPYPSRARSAETRPDVTSSRTRPGSRANGSPNPPPPAACTTTTSPATSGKPVALPGVGNSSSRPSRTTETFTGAAGPAPPTPKGGIAARSLRTE